MENKTPKERREIYSSINQPVSYAIVYGLVPELRELLKAFKPKVIKAESKMRELCLDDKIKI